MRANEIAQKVYELEHENEFLKNKNKQSFSAEKFYNTALTTSEVAKLHGVSPTLVREYIKRGYIDVHPDSTEAKILIRGSDALILDFKKLKKEYSFEKIYGKL